MTARRARPHTRYVGICDGSASGSSNRSGSSGTGAFFVASQLALDKRGYRIIVNNGDDAGQTVDYLHAHILGGRALGGS